MKKTINYKGYTFTYHTDGHCALVFKGTNLTDEQLNNTPIKCVAGSSLKQAIEKTKTLIDLFCSYEMSVIKQSELYNKSNKTNEEWEQYYTVCEQTGKLQSQLMNNGCIYNNETNQIEKATTEHYKWVNQFKK